MLMILCNLLGLSYDKRLAGQDNVMPEILYGKKKKNKWKVNKTIVVSPKKCRWKIYNSISTYFIPEAKG